HASGELPSKPGQQADSKQTRNCEAMHLCEARAGAGATEVGSAQTLRKLPMALMRPSVAMPSRVGLDLLFSLFFRGFVGIPSERSFCLRGSSLRAGDRPAVASNPIARRCHPYLSWACSSWACSSWAKVGSSTPLSDVKASSFRQLWNGGHDV